MTGENLQPFRKSRDTAVAAAVPADALLEALHGARLAAAAEKAGLAAPPDAPGGDGARAAAGGGAAPRRVWAQLTAIVGASERLRIVPPTNLREVSLVPPLLTLSKDGALCVFRGRPKGAVGSITLFDVVAGETDDVSIDELVAALREVPFAAVRRFVREPTEAIMVLIDTSKSMNEFSFPGTGDFGGTMTRISAVKQLFAAFANRSAAYNYPHSVGLVEFSTTAKVRCPLTHAWEHFVNVVNALEVDNKTALVDALMLGRDELLTFRAAHRACALRIVIFTDGENTSERYTALQVVQAMQDASITVDAFCVGEEENVELKAIAFASGGICCRPKRMTEAVSLIENEAVLTLGAREMPVPLPPRVRTDEELEAYFNKRAHPYTTAAPAKSLERLLRPAVGLRESLKTVAAAAVAPHRRLARIRAEMVRCGTHPHPNFTVFPLADDISIWRVLLQGPHGTPYQGGVFELLVPFPDEYPMIPPEVRFVTPIVHCNINSSGKVCHAVFDRSYSPETRMQTIFQCVYGLLLVPEPLDPLDSFVADLYLTQRYVPLFVDPRAHSLRTAAARAWGVCPCLRHATNGACDRDKYDVRVRESVRTHASVPLAEMRVRIAPGARGAAARADGVECPREYTCPISLEMFIDPVITHYGTT